MSPFVAFFDGEGVDVDTDAGHGARTARIENGDGARSRPVSEEVGGYAVLKRRSCSLLNQISIMADDGGGFDDVDAGLLLETERLEALHDEPRRFEFAPTFFRVE